MDAESQDGASRRNVLKTGALGMGALATVMGVGGLTESSAQAAAPEPHASAPGAPVDLFLKLDGIEGDATDKSHKNEIELLSFSWGASNSGSAGGGGGGTGKVAVQDFAFTSLTSKASPTLFLACATGKHIKDATLSVRRNTIGSPTYIKMVLGDVLVSSYQTGGADTAPTDAMSLNFAKLAYTVYPVDALGRPGTPVTAVWDVRGNQGG